MPKATPTVSRLSPTAIAASGIARRIRIRARKVTRVIAAITSGIRSRVTLAVVVQLGGAAGDPGFEVGVLAEGLRFRVERLVQRDRAGGVEAVVGDHQQRRRLAAVGDVDRLRGRFAHRRRRPVERREDEVARVEDARRRPPHFARLLAHLALPLSTCTPASESPLFQRRRFFGAFGQPRFQRFGAAFEPLDAADQGQHPAAQLVAPRRPAAALPSPVFRPRRRAGCRLCGFCRGLPGAWRRRSAASSAVPAPTGRTAAILVASSRSCEQPFVRAPPVRRSARRSLRRRERRSPDRCRRPPPRLSAPLRASPA